MNDKFCLVNGRVVDPARNLDEVMPVAVNRGVIVDAAKIDDSYRRIDCTGKIVCPGFIDLHVHLRQPGNVAAETIASGTAAAAAGGFTAVVAMPNTSPAADNAGAIEYLRQMAARTGMVRVIPCGCLTKNYAGEEMAGIGSLAQAGVLALSDDGKCIQDHSLMRHVMQYARSFHLPVLDHCEENSLKGGGVMHEGTWSVLLGMSGIPSIAEELIVARDIMLARDTGCRIHIQHASTAGSVNLIRAARKKNLPVTGEATPHHLTLTDEMVKTYDTNYKMNPPLRSEEDRKALVKAVLDGTITVIATDHAPHTQTAKLVEFDNAPFGIIGLETAVPLTLGVLVHKGRMPISKYVSCFTAGPAQILSLDWDLAPGREANVTVLDLEDEFTIDASKFKSKARNTPFDHWKCKGRAVLTVSQGRIVHSLLD
ncbi:MAG: dihydroorotase [Victivallaceae bacterium]|nr:dihydroorotase [Victivallaceae bacterium]